MTRSLSASSGSASTGACFAAITNRKMERPEIGQLEWTPQRVARFWDRWANSPELHEQYFTFQVGEGIVNFLEALTDLKDKRIMDYGCGPGFLEDYLLKRGARVTAADYSPATVKSANERFVGRPGWDGAIEIVDGEIDVPDAAIDIVTCIETIEHMFEADRKKMFSEFWRVLKASGHLMVTTPNEEDLRGHSVLCPQCNQLFHSMQHMCSWTANSLTAALQEAGFRVDFCRGIHLAAWMPQPQRKLIDYSLRDVRHILTEGARKAADWIFPRPFPGGRVFRRLTSATKPVHLVAIASKP